MADGDRKNYTICGAKVTLREISNPNSSLPLQEITVENSSDSKIRFSDTMYEAPSKPLHTLLHEEIGQRYYAKYGQGSDKYPAVKINSMPNDGYISIISGAFCIAQPGVDPTVMLAELEKEFKDKPLDELMDSPVELPKSVQENSYPVDEVLTSHIDQHAQGHAESINSTAEAVMSKINLLASAVGLNAAQLKVLDGAVHEGLMKDALAKQR